VPDGYPNSCEKVLHLCSSVGQDGGTARLRRKRTLLVERALACNGGFSLRPDLG
jgi:hypothetical protein